MLFETLAGIAADDEHRVRVPAEGLNHAGSVEAAPARRFADRIDIGAVLECQAIDAEYPVDGRVNGKSNDQAIILRENFCGFYAFTAKIASSATPVRLPSTSAKPASRSNRV